MLASSTINIVLPLIAALVVFTGVGLAVRNRKKSSESAVEPDSATETRTSAKVSATKPDSADSSSVATSSAGAAADSETLEPAKSDESVVGDEAELASAEEVVPPSGEDTRNVGDAEEPEVPSVRGKAGRTRSLFASAFQSIRGRGSLDAAAWDELEETLLRADIGIGLATRLLDPLRAAAKAGTIRTPDDAIIALREAMTAQLATTNRSLHLDAEKKPNVWLFVGVNGVGKTTTIGKIGTAQTALGTTVLMAAGDTFRAAAAEQLHVWAERCGASYVRGAEGGDPASVIFDGIQSASAKGIDLVLGDTAGRLQNKSNLMEELKKVRRVAAKAEGTVNEVLLVIDATTGQNGLSQAREFAAATDVTGVVLTKLDGSAKGGIVFAIETDLGIPVKLVGLGEGAHDLVTFDPAEYVSALFE